MKAGRSTLLRARCGALDPGDALELQAEGVDVPPASPAPDPPAWRVVPPFLPRVTDVHRVALHLTDEAPAPGDRIRFAVPRPTGTGDVLVLLEGPDWHVVFPTGPDDVVHASALDGDASHVWIDLVVPDAPTPRIAAFADPPDWRSDPWAPLRDAIAAGAATYPLVPPGS